MTDRKHVAKTAGLGLRMLALLALVVTTCLGATTPASAQGGDTAQMDIGAYGPNGHEIGAQFTVTIEDGTFLGSCTLEGYGDEPYALGCQVDVPRGTTVVVTLDVATITPGYAPVENPLYFDTSSNPGAASSWGVAFQIEPQGGNASIDQTSDVAIVTTENGQAAYDACYVLVDFSNEGCDENGDGQITFQDVPLGDYTVRQTADLGPDRSVDDFAIQVSGNQNATGFEIFSATIISASGSSPDPEVSSQSGAVDIALITRDPDDGHLLTGACYVLVDFSNEGCDENGDGQVTFAEIPYGTYTVQQTQTPAGYPTINDYEITVSGGGLYEGPSLGVSQGFVVKQAPEQNAPNTRNVSIVFLDDTTHERIIIGGCVEIVGASEVGCDRDLIDGQIDFLDVPEGDAYQLGFSNLPAGYEVTGLNVPAAAVSVFGGPDAPANYTFYAFVDQSGLATDPATASGEATMLMTFRACPEGFDPDTGDFSADCTIPLDAPDAAFLYHGGDGQGGMNITWLDRQYNGEYVFNAGPGTMSLQLSGLAPELRDAYEVVGADGVNGDTYTVDLVDGETREVFVFYYYE